MFARFDEKIVFTKLDYETQVQIAENLLISEIHLLCTQKKVTISTTGSVLNHLIKRGFDRVLGARPMRGAVEREIGNAWSRFLLQRLKAGETVRVGEELVLLVKEQELELIPRAALPDYGGSPIIPLDQTHIPHIETAPA